MKALERWASRALFVPVAAVRTYLLLKCTLLILAFDVWLTHVPHGGRYGAGGFNVAHFAWLDAVQPSVSPGLYVAVSILTGLLCFALALAPRPPRWLLGLAFALYTWGWAMSMLDSYQHHYLLSLVLLALIFFPRLSAEQALLLPELPEPEKSAPRPKKGKKKKAKALAAQMPPLRLTGPAPTTHGWAYVLLMWSITIVYAYAAFSKTSADWLDGTAMQRVLRLPAGGEVAPDGWDPVGPVRALASVVGLEGESFWWLMGHSVVLVQLICAAAYVLAPFRDSLRNKALDAFMWVALLVATSFHLGAEHMQLKIGWFSWYMVAFALCTLLPARVLAALMRVALPLARRAVGPELLMARVAVGLLLTLAGLIAYSKGYGGLTGDVERFAETFVDPAVLLSLGVMLLLVTPLRMLLHAGAADEKREPSSYAGLPAALAGALMLGIAGYQIDLPGAAIACVIAGCGLGAGCIGLLVMRGDARAIHPYGVGAAVGALAFVLVIWQSDVRFDFWRNVGGDHRRRGELVTAYEAYVKANCYAPEGVRRNQEDSLRDTLREQGVRVPEVECRLSSK